MRQVTRGEIKTRARELAGVVNDPNVTDDWLNSLFTLHFQAQWRFLTTEGPADYYSETTILTATPGVIPNALPDTVERITAVYAQIGERRIPLNPITDRRRQHFRAPTSAHTVELEYIPSCPVLT